MSKLFFKILFVFILTPIIGQNTTWNAPKNKIVIPFESVFNLIILPVEVNNVKLKMIFDTGSEHSMVFSFAETDSIILNQTQKTKIYGLGKGNYIEGLLSLKNNINCKGLQNKDFNLLVVLDEQINMSAKLGITVNGILSASVFKDYVFTIDYIKKIVTVYKNPQEISSKKYRKYEKIPISIFRNKPYIKLKTLLVDNPKNVSMLIDSGLSDAIWLFESDTIQQKGKYFTDHLGTGIGGEIIGKKALINQFNLGKFIIKKPLVAFPEADYFKNIDTIHPRNGSIGGNLLSRFTVVFDYLNNSILLKKNHTFNNPYDYNKAGIEVQHNGIQWVKEEIPYRLFTGEKGERVTFEAERFKYQFVLKPIFEIASIRKNSSAEKAGLQVGDVLVKINTKNTTDLTIEKIMKLFHSEDTKIITLEILRKGQTLNINFEVESLLE